MPTYEYHCNACGHDLEIFQSMKDAPKRKCPKCGKSALERKIGTGAAILFKGSGFYQTDYRSEAYKKSAESDKKPAETKADGGAGGAAAAKPDSAASTKSEAAPKEPAPKKDPPKPARADDKKPKPRAGSK